MLTGAGALLAWSAVGFALGRRILPATLALPAAPALGWACHSALALPVLRAAGTARWMVAAAFLFPLAAAAWSLAATPGSKERSGAARVPALAYALAALLAVVPELALLPKVNGEAIALAAPIFDHAKIALIDDIARLGVAWGNPFFGEAGGETGLAYYYLWHFSAAEFAVAFGASGWEADIALTAFTAFASLALMSGLAVWIGDRGGAGLLVVPLAFAASLHPALETLLGPEAFYSIFLPPTGLAGWLFQSAWAPQHSAAASCVVLSFLLAARLGQAPSPLTALALALTAAAGYGSSLWIGGVLFGLASPVLAMLLIAQSAPAQRKRIAALTAGAGLLAILLVFPLVRDQAAAAAARDIHRPIALQAYPVFGVWIPENLRAVLDIPGFWLALLPIEFPAIYLPGLISLAASLRMTSLAPPVRDATRAFAVLTVASLLAAGWLTTTFADNNDLGWRAALPGVFVMTIFAATGLSRWLTTGRRFAAAGALALLALSLPKSIQLLKESARGSPSEQGAAFAQTPAMWAQVRRHAAADDRVGNNPLFMARMTPWPVNISWALLADRRSCYAGRELALAFAPLSRARAQAVDQQFERVFDGRAAPNDVRDLAARFGCRVIVVTAQDGAWRRDPFKDGGFYTLVEENPAGWRIYRASDPRP